jgi:LPXTG-motif cell wall-anchored protein
MFLPKPLYESLPYLYGAIGLVCLLGSWRLADQTGSAALAIFGAAAIILGAVVLLRRRDYREQKRRYGSPFDES